MQLHYQHTLAAATGERALIECDLAPTKRAQVAIEAAEEMSMGMPAVGPRRGLDFLQLACGLAAGEEPGPLCCNHGSSE